MNPLFIGLTVIVIIILVILIFWRFYFLRDPVRKIPLGENIVSPADGRINKIIRSDAKNHKIKKGLLGRINTIASDVAKDYVVVNIVMTPLDVHYQRAPIMGKVLYTKYKKGKFRNAVTDRIAIENENNAILIEGKFRVKVIQIAGVLARRINCYVKKNEKIQKGEHIGLINLGSQVTTIMPGNVKLKVKEGQRVKAGETIIAEV